MEKECAVQVDEITGKVILTAPIQLFAPHWGGGGCTWVCMCVWEKVITS